MLSSYTKFLPQQHFVIDCYRAPRNPKNAPGWAASMADSITPLGGAMIRWNKHWKSRQWICIWGVGNLWSLSHKNGSGEFEHVALFCRQDWRCWYIYLTTTISCNIYKDISWDDDQVARYINESKPNYLFFLSPLFFFSLTQVKSNNQLSKMSW